MNRSPRLVLIHTVFWLVVVPNICLGTTITFAGREWQVKSGTGGPGPNNWSDSQSSVWVDAQGQLHLKIRRVGSTWYCAEVTTTLPTSYGMHRFYTIGSIDTLDRNVVLAQFLYVNDNREIDIEFSRWGSSSNPNGQYVLQPAPYVQGDNINRFTFTLTGTYSTHYIYWTASSVTFKSIHGHYQEPPDVSHLIQEWSYSGSRNLTQSEAPTIHISLWLVGGHPPVNGQESEIIVSGADLPGPPMSINQRNGSIPSIYSLLQNYPNPFNPTTTLQFDLPRQGSVTLRIYNVLGELLATLVDGLQEPGYKSVQWNASHVASGVYFYRLQAGEFVEVKKMILMK